MRLCVTLINLTNLSLPSLRSPRESLNQCLFEVQERFAHFALLSSDFANVVPNDVHYTRN